jgi:hypothetical protein
MFLFDLHQEVTMYYDKRYISGKIVLLTHQDNKHGKSYMYNIQFKSPENGVVGSSLVPQDKLVQYQQHGLGKVDNDV